MFDGLEKSAIQAVQGKAGLGDQLLAATLSARVGTVSLLKDRVVLLAVIATVTACANVLQPSFIENKAPTRKAIWDILVALGGMTATLVLQYAGDTKYSTPKGLPGRNAPE